MQRESTLRSNNVLIRSLRRFWSAFQEMSRMMERAHSAEVKPGSYDKVGPHHWEPIVTEMPAGRDLVLYFELPEVEHENMDLSLQGDSLVVSGVRQDPPSLENVTAEGIISGELDIGPVQQSTFKRTVELPRPVEEEEVEAAFGAGLLQVRVVGAAEDRPRNVRIRNKRRHRK